MPRKRITFIVIPPNDGQVQEFRLSARLVWIAGLICIVFVGASASTLPTITLAQTRN